MSRVGQNTEIHSGYMTVGGLNLGFRVGEWAEVIGCVVELKVELKGQTVCWGELNGTRRRGLDEVGQREELAVEVGRSTSPVFTTAVRTQGRERGRGTCRVPTHPLRNLTD